MPTPSGIIGISDVNNEIRWPVTRTTGASERPINILERHLPPEVAWSRLRNKQAWVTVDAITGVGAGGGLGPFNALSYFPELANGDLVSWDLQGQGWGGVGQQFLVRIFAVIGGPAFGFNGNKFDGNYVEYGSGKKTMLHWWKFDGGASMNFGFYVSKGTSQYNGQQFLRKISWWAYGTTPATHGQALVFCPMPWCSPPYTYAQYDSVYGNNNA